MMFYFFIIWLLLTVFVSWLATIFNRSFAMYFFLGTIFSPAISLIVLLIKGKNVKLCPQCAEGIKHEANICKHCGYKFVTEKKVELQTNASTTFKEKITFEQYSEAREKLAKGEMSEAEYSEISKKYLLK